MKKVLSVVLALIMVLALCSAAFAVDEKEVKTLQFNEDGKFKIMQINDTQDTDKMHKKTEKFIKAALEQEKPDLVVVPGDIANDIFIGANAKKITTCMYNLGNLLNEAKVPFAITFGNHDHDRSDKLPIADMMKVFEQFEYCINNEGCDPGTYNIPIWNSAHTSYALNIYMMDSNNKSGVVSGYEGVRADQVEWYKQKSDELKAANGGKVVPSLVFQHVPVKEIYQFFEKTDATQSNVSIFSTNDNSWYKPIDKYFIDDESVRFVGEAPCSEYFESTGGQYDAWLEKGDIIGAFFAHDHVNSFVGKTDEGIILGYNGGTGFKAYGNADKRTVRIFEIDENNVENYTTRPVFYCDVTGEHFSYYISDIMSTAIFGDILRFFCRLFFITSWK